MKTDIQMTDIKIGGLVIITTPPPFGTQGPQEGEVALVEDIMTRIDGSEPTLNLVCLGHDGRVTGTGSISASRVSALTNSPCWERALTLHRNREAKFQEEWEALKQKTVKGFQGPSNSPMWFFGPEFRETGNHSLISIDMAISMLESVNEGYLASRST